MDDVSLVLLERYVSELREAVDELAATQARNAERLAQLELLFAAPENGQPELRIVRE